MYNLAFDTTSSGCSVVLMKDKTKLAVFHQNMDFGQAEVLLPEIQNLLQQNGITFADIGLLTVCVGPGSFTGVRASIAAARAFGVAAPNLNLAGITAFDAYIRSLSWCPEEVATLNLVIIETKREDFYFQLFDKKLHKLTEPAAAAYEDIIPLLRGKKVSLIGDGVERFLSRPHNLSLHAIKCLSGVDIVDLALCGLEAYADKRMDYPKPLYLRAPDVCVKKSA